MRLAKGEALRKVSDLTAVLFSVDEGDTLAIERADLGSPLALTMLGSAYRDRTVMVDVGKGGQITSIPLELPSFSIVATVTREWAMRAGSPPGSVPGHHLCVCRCCVPSFRLRTDRSLQPPPGIEMHPMRHESEVDRATAGGSLGLRSGEGFRPSIAQLCRE